MSIAEDFLLSIIISNKNIKPQNKGLKAKTVQLSSSLRWNFIQATEQKIKSVYENLNIL